MPKNPNIKKVLDELLYHFYGQRLDVNAVCDIFIGHDGCRVRV